MAEKSEPTSQPIEHEPFGQMGTRQLVAPMLVLLSLSLATASALLWYRSFTIADIIVRNAIIRELSFRSVYGRILIAQFDWDIDAAGAKPQTAWVYETRLVPPNVRDEWPASWEKTIGVEWRGEAYAHVLGVRNGWWIRIRWRTILILTIIPPIVHIIRHRRILRRRPP